jgi:hypothetical protein
MQTHIPDAIIVEPIAISSKFSEETKENKLN